MIRLSRHTVAAAAFALLLAGCGKSENSAPVKPKGPDLSKYVGKYPFDPVDGIAWYDHPVIQAGVKATVKDADIAAVIVDPAAGPSGPIWQAKGKINAWGCEQHNCGDHQWTVMVKPETGKVDVCYADASKTPGQSRWIFADGRDELRDDSCPQE